MIAQTSQAYDLNEPAPSPCRPQRSFFLLLAALLLCPAALSMAQRMPQDSWYLGQEIALRATSPETGVLNQPNDAALGPDGLLDLANR